MYITKAISMFGLNYSTHIFYTKTNTKHRRVVFHQNLRTGVKGKGALSEKCGGSDVYDHLKTGKRNQACSAVFLLPVLLCVNGGGGGS